MYFQSISKAVLLICVIVLSACESKPIQEAPTVSPYNYVSSTEYFADRTSSISMRAAFSKTDSKMAEGYRFQFRTINKGAVFLDSISVIAGGKRIFLEENQIVLPPDRGLTLQLPMEDSLFVAKFPTTLLQFRQNNVSYIFAIELHQLRPFTPQ